MFVTQELKTICLSSCYLEGKPDSITLLLKALGGLPTALSTDYLKMFSNEVKPFFKPNLRILISEACVSVEFHYLSVSSGL